MISLSTDEAKALKMLLSDDDPINRMAQSYMDMIESGEWQASPDEKDFIRRFPSILYGLKDKLATLGKRP